MWRLSAHSIGTKASFIHLSLVASRWGHPTGRVWFFSHSIASKSSKVIWSVFLQDGVTLFGSGSKDLISSEVIPTVGLLGAFFRPVLGVSFCLPLVGWSALLRGGFHIQLSSLLALLPLALSWWIGLLRRPLLPLVAVATLAGFVWWSSSGSACRRRWAPWGGCRAQGHSFSWTSMAKFADFLLWLPRSQGFSFSSIRSYRLMLSYRFTLSFGPSCTPFGCFPLAGLFALLLGPLRCFFAIYLPRRSHRSVRLLSARLSRWFSSLWP